MLVDTEDLLPLENENTDGAAGAEPGAGLIGGGGTERDTGDFAVAVAETVTELLELLDICTAAKF